MSVIKRMAGILLAVSFALTFVFAGCGAQKEGTVGSTNSTVQESSATVEETQKTLDPVELTWYYPSVEQADQQLVQDEFNKKLKDKINATVNFQVVDWGKYEEKMNMVMAAQEPYDICFTASWFNNFYNKVSKGAYLPLDELVDNSAPKIKEVLPKSLLDVARINGKLYGIPNYQSMAANWGLAIPKDLVDKYKLDTSSIKALKDIEPFLEQIKKGEPDLYPYYVNYEAFYNDYEPIGVTPAFLKIDDATLKIVDKYETQEWKDYVQLMRDWFLKGYIRKDMASVKDETPDLDAQKYAVSGRQTSPGSVGGLMAKYNKEYVEIKLDIPYIRASSGAETISSIGKDSKNPERAVMLLELMNTDKELYNLICFGLDGTHYKKIADDQIEILPDSKYNPGVTWELGDTFNAFYTTGQKPGLWDETKLFNETAKVSVIRGFSFNPESVTNELTQIAAVEKEYDLLRKGALDYEKVYPVFLEKLKNAGLQKVIDEVQNQLNEWAKTR